MPISDRMLAVFTNVARALASGAKDTGYFSNGIRRLDFTAKDDDGRKKVFTAIQQNPNKISTPAKLAREGHEIVQIRDNDRGGLLGFVDLTENRFNSFENVPQALDIEDIEASLGANVAKEGDIKVTNTRTATQPFAGQAAPTDRLVDEGAIDMTNGDVGTLRSFDNEGARGSNRGPEEANRGPQQGNPPRDKAA